MRVSRVTLVPGFALAAGMFALLGPSLQAGTTQGANPLQPLSERDMTDTRESGCTCTFDRGRATLIQMMGKEFMLRTRAGRQVCPITDRQFGSFSERVPVTCGGRTFTLRHTGRTVSHEESDSAVTPAALTITWGRSRTVLNGSWGCAC